MYVSCREQGSQGGKTCRTAASLGFPAAQVTRTVKEALGIATQMAMHQAPSTTPLIVVTGSFYTAGEAKEVLGQKGVLGGLRE